MTTTLVQDPLPRANRSFTREDLAKAENRINVALFGAHGIPEFWGPLCDLLGIPRSAWLTREVVAGTGNRPDFIVNGMERDQGCIEVELGRQNEQQLGSYRKAYSPVICIVGKRSSLPEHPSLEVVADLARSVAKVLQNTNQPGMAVLDHLAATVEEGLNGFRSRASVQDIPTRLLEFPWFTTIFESLRRLERAGYVKNRPTSSMSLSIQLVGVRCMKATRFALLTQRDPSVIQLPTPGEMDRVLGVELAGVTAAWNDLLKLVMPNWRIHLDGNKRICIPTKEFEPIAEAFAAVFGLLTERILSLHADFTAIDVPDESLGSGG